MMTEYLYFAEESETRCSGFYLDFLIYAESCHLSGALFSYVSEKQYLKSGASS
jgi:hypothetical protein